MARILSSNYSKIGLIANVPESDVLSSGSKKTNSMDIQLPNWRKWRAITTRICTHRYCTLHCRVCLTELQSSFQAHQNQVRVITSVTHFPNVISVCKAMLGGLSYSLHFQCLTHCIVRVLRVLAVSSETYPISTRISQKDACIGQMDIQKLCALWS